MAGKLLLSGGKLVLAGGKMALQDIVSTPPTIAVSVAGSGDINEGPAAEYVFTVELSAAYDRDIQFTYGTANITAIAGTNYQAASGVATIPAGLTSVEIGVSIIDNSTFHGNRTFSFSISNALVVGVGVSLTITNASRTVTIIEDEEEPVDPPPPAGTGSPIAALEHPRFLMVPENEDYVFGSKASTFRTKMATASYATQWQSYVTDRMSRFSYTYPATYTTSGTGTENNHIWDAIFYAMMAYVDPSTMPSVDFGGVTKAQFITRAKSMLNRMVEDYMYPTTRSESSQDSIDAPKSMGAAAVYSFLMAADNTTFSLAERQTLAEAAITAMENFVDDVAGANPWFLSENSHYYWTQGVALCAALYGDSISGNSVKTGRPFSTDIETGKDRFLSRIEYMTESAEWLREGEGYHQESDMYYGIQWFWTAHFATLMYSTAKNDNLFYTKGFWRNRATYLYRVTQPQAFIESTNGVTQSKYRPVRRDTAANENAASVTTYNKMIGVLEGWDDRRAGVIKYLLNDILDGATPSIYGTTTDGSALLYKFMYGAQHVNAITPVEDVDVPLRSSIGIGGVVLRDSMEKTLGNTLIVFTPITHRIGGHQHTAYNMGLWMYKWGTITAEGGIGKNGSSSFNTGSAGANPFSQFNKGRSGAGHVFALQNLAVTTLNTAAVLSTPTNISSLNPAVCTSAANCGSTSYITKYLGTDGAAAFLVNGDRIMDTAKGTYFRRGVMWFPDEGGPHDYIIVWDRATKHATNNIQSLVCMPSPNIAELPEGTFTLSLGPGTAGTAPYVIPTGEFTGSGDLSLLKFTNVIDNADSVMFMRTLRPSSISVYTVGGNSGWFSADLVPGVRNKNIDSGYATRNMGDQWAAYYMRYHTEVRINSSPGAQDEMIQVLQLSRNSTTPTATMSNYIESGDGSMNGAAIMDSNRTRVGLSPKAHAWAVVNTAFTVTLPSGATTPTRFCVMRIAPNTAYNVSRVGLNVTFTPGSGSSMSNSEGVLEVTV